MAGAARGDHNDVRRVLVVEDEFLIAMDLRSLLVESGFSVLGPAGTVADALELLEGETPDIALLDVNIGDERVTPVAVRLRSLDVPFILSSASVGSGTALPPILDPRGGREHCQASHQRILLDALYSFLK
ncbi:response regulator [Rhizobium wenxiniae]|uniref:response regulator n=1 Tax=Rhizobium wenxiniae TaxID=1737357 RepID=UPI001C6E9290|nr:response regulator [Rhizobium wenxiniae]MBW9091629.1 response regulator [Rhizobium wenxiniae]